MSLYRHIPPTDGCYPKWPSADGQSHLPPPVALSTTHRRFTRSQHYLLAGRLPAGVYSAPGAPLDSLAELEKQTRITKLITWAAILLSALSVALALDRLCASEPNVAPESSDAAAADPSLYGPPVAFELVIPQPPQPYLDYITEHARPGIDTLAAWELIVAASLRWADDHPDLPPPDPAVLLVLAAYESEFRANCTGAAGERGMLQVHPCHRRSMARAGLDFSSEADRLYFALDLFNERGWQPWAVRKRAQRDLARLGGD